MPVNWEDLIGAFDYLQADESASAVVHRDTGEVFTKSLSADIDEFPEDVDEDPAYIPLPRPRDLDLGGPLVMQFARDELPDHYDEIDGIFSRKGAYRRFKDYLRQIDRLDEWHAYEEAAAEKALRAWCAENAIELKE
jgi:hypothetical protein